jgi:hypothetical protein
MDDKLMIKYSDGELSMNIGIEATNFMQVYRISQYMAMLEKVMINHGEQVNNSDMVMSWGYILRKAT